MNETYVECLVKGKSSGIMKVLNIFLWIVAVLLFIFGMGTGMFLGEVLGIVVGIGAYYIGFQVGVEYEYLYLDKEITVDKILGKNNRKKVGVYPVDKIEIFAPIKSYHLDDYKNRQVQTFDFSIGVEEKPDRRYVMYYNGEKKILLSPNEEFVKALKNVAPRKVFMD